jgi:hypothetical protein
MKVDKATYSPNLPVEQCISGKLPLELVRAAVIVEEKTSLESFAFGLAQELCSVGVVVQHPERSDGHDYRDDSLEDEDPPPSFVACGTIHQIDQPSEQTTECTGSSSGTEEEGNSEVDLVSSVPLGQAGLSKLQSLPTH